MADEKQGFFEWAKSTVSNLVDSVIDPTKAEREAEAAQRKKAEPDHSREPGDAGSGSRGGMKAYSEATRAHHADTSHDLVPPLPTPQGVSAPSQGRDK